MGTNMTITYDDVLLSIASDDEICRLLRAMPIPDHLGGGLCKRAADRIAYLSAQEELLDEAFEDRDSLLEALRDIRQLLFELQQRGVDTPRGDGANGK